MSGPPNIDLEIRLRFLKLMRFIIADVDRYGIRNQQEFAHAIGCLTQNLSRLKSDPARPVPLIWIHNTGMRFDIDTDWIVTGRGKMPAAPGPAYTRRKISTPRT